MSFNVNSGAGGHPFDFSAMRLTPLPKATESKIDQSVLQQIGGAGKSNAPVSEQQLDTALQNAFKANGLGGSKALPEYEAAIHKAYHNQGSMSADDTHNLLAGLFGQGKALPNPVAAH